MVDGYIGSAREQDQIERRHTPSEAVKPPRRTVGHAIERTEGVGSSLDVTRSEMQTLAERAAKLATYIGGSYAVPSAGKDPAGNTEASVGGPLPTVEALHRRIDELRPKIDALTDPFLQIAHALDAIERAIG